MNTWKIYKLSETCSKIGSGATPKGGKSAYLSDGISLIRSQNVLDFTFSEDGLAFINNAQAKALANVEVQERDVLVNITGDSVARVCQVPNGYLPARVNQHVAILRANHSKLTPEFLKYSLLNKNNKDKLLSLASTGATRNALTKGMLEEFEISVPEDIAVQNRIAEILSALDEKIELNRRMNHTLEQMAQTLFQQYFVNDIDEENLSEEWKEGKLVDVLGLSYGKALKQGDRKGGNFPVVGSSGVVGYHNSFIADGNGIVVGRKGNSGAIIWLDEKFFPIDTTYYVVDKLFVNGLYFHYFLLKSLPLKEMNSDSAVPGLNRNDAYNINILVPRRERIIDFNNKVKFLFDLKFKNEKEIRTLTNLRDTLLPKLMSGEIDVMQTQPETLHEPVLS